MKSTPRTLAIVSFRRSATGVLYSWGNNSDGQLGLGDTTTRLQPMRVHGIKHIFSVAAGGRHSMAMNDNSEVYTWGSDVHGGLGHGGGGESAVEPRYRALSVQTVPRLVRHLLTEGVRVTKIAVGATQHEHRDGGCSSSRPRHGCRRGGRTLAAAEN